MAFVRTPIEVKVVTYDKTAATRVTPRQKLASVVGSLRRQPLIHFLLAGVVLFAVATIVERNGASDSKTIHVTNAEIRRLQEVWVRQYGRSPSPTELQNLVNDYIREEVYYREAVASGLDKEDTIIRRRLVEKMEFLSQEISDATPDDRELQAYFLKNQEKFQIPARIAFVHIFFSPSKHGVAIEADAQRTLSALRSPKADETLLSRLGDPFMLQSEYPPQTLEEVKALFGEEFAAELFAAPVGQWTGPIRSSYGIHLVRIVQYTPSHLPTLDEVHNQVVTDFKNDRLQAASERYYAGLRKNYRVEVDNDALARTVSTPPNLTTPAQKAAPDED